MTDGDEQRLIERLRQGGDGAFNDLIARYEADVFCWAATWLPHADAEQVAQEVFIAAFYAVESLPDSDLRTWLRRLAAETVDDWRRSEH